MLMRIGGRTLVWWIGTAAALALGGTAAAQTSTLSVTRAGTGTGTVTSVPAAINCPGQCSFVFPINTVVSLASVPAAGSTFLSFVGADSSSGNVASVTMSGNPTVTVNLRCAADFNGSGAVSVQDIVDFLSVYFAGCP